MDMDQRVIKMQTAMEALATQATANSNSLAVMNANMDALRNSMLAMEQMMQMSFQNTSAQTGNPPGHGKVANGSKDAAAPVNSADGFADDDEPMARHKPY